MFFLPFIVGYSIVRHPLVIVIAVGAVIGLVMHPMHMQAQGPVVGETVGHPWNGQMEVSARSREWCKPPVKNAVMHTEGTKFWLDTVDGQVEGQMYPDGTVSTVMGDHHIFGRFYKDETRQERFMGTDVMGECFYNLDMMRSVVVRPDTI